MWSPATPGWGSPWCWWWVAPCHSWLRVLGAVPRNSQLGSAGCGGGRFRGVGWGVSCVVCVCGVVSVLVCVTCVRGGGVGVGVSPVCVGVCVCVCVRLVSAAGACRWCMCGCGWCVSWLVPRHSWLRAPGAVRRHSWLGSAGGGCVCSRATPGSGSWLRFPATPGWGGRWWRWWVGPCHSWLRVSGAVPRHSWLGSAGRGGGCFRGWGFPVLCVLVVRHVRVVSVLVCVECVCGVCVGGGAGVSVSPACVCVCVCVRVWCVGGVWLPVLASSGCCWCWWGCGWCVLWLVRRHNWRGFLCATPRHSWLGFAAGGGGCSSPLLAEGPGCGSPPLLAGVCRQWWCPAPRHSRLGPAGCGGVFRGWGCPLLCVFVLCVAARGGCAVLCVACLWCPCCWWCGVVVRLGCVFGVPWLAWLRVCRVPVVRGCVSGVPWCPWLRVCGVPVVRGLLSPPLLVRACGWCLCGCGWCVVWVLRHSWLRDLGAVPRQSWLESAVVWWWLVPYHSWLGGLVAGPPDSWLGFAAGCGGWSLATPGRGSWAWFPATPGWGPPVLVVGARSPLLAVGPGVPFSLGLVCLCVLCGALCWCGWSAGVVCSVVAVCVRVCACGVWFVGCGIPWLVLVVSWHGRGQEAEEKQKKRSCRCAAEMRDMRNAKYIPLYLSHGAFSPL